MVDTHRAVRIPELADLERAYAAVRIHLAPTPLIPTTANDGALLKLECWQPTGSFKVRGAFAAISALPHPARAAGVVTASTGNHALAIAHAAARLNLTATVVVPATASPAKIDALQRLGARLIQQGDGFDAAEAYALELAVGGATYISAYNDTHVIAGQASLGFELGAQLDAPATVIVPVGGGGLIAGLTLWAAGRDDVRVVGVEAEASRAVSAAMAAGHTVGVGVGPTLADALAGNLEPGSVTPAVLVAHATTVLAVSEAEIRNALRFLAREHGLAVEGAGAVAVAALLAGKLDVDDRRAIAVVTGRNIALSTLATALGRS
ncbi:pyridoxal-phosphate dependent enzyme [Micromonosporaceae bacterium B7E4]